ncbi:hypothetical protein G6F50_013674 [Rhizopus delemar]|uniref:Uncharacterized protein n=1 Tax=Rhizopus delemar TaxID=936053 RepID=A0A9P6YE25_9FUNG|nr:hypothetical protein G6F50_013674 [Rhizopus delemar]
MVEIWRWPKAPYSAPSMAPTVMPRRAALARSIWMFWRSPALSTSVPTSRSFGQVVALQRNAVLRALAGATAIVAGQVLDRAQAQLQVRVAVGLGTQPRQCMRGGFAAAVAARFQLDVELRAGALAAAAQANAHGLHRRVGHQHVGDAALAGDHVLEGDGGAGVGAAPDQAGVLRRERTLFHCTEQEHGDADQDQRGQRHQQRVAQREVEEHSVDEQHALVAGIEPAAEARRRRRVVVRAEEAAAQRRGQRQRDDHRDHDGRHQGDGEFAEERAHHAAGEQQRDEHRHQRGAPPACAACPRRGGA